MRLIEQQREGRLRSLVLPALAITQATWLASSALRSQQRRMALAPAVAHNGDLSFIEDVAVTLERHVLDREQLSLVLEELARCSAREQAVFADAYGQPPKSYATIADERGLSIQRARQIVCEVRTRLRAVLREIRESS